MARLPFSYCHVLATHLHLKYAIEAVSSEREFCPCDGLVMALAHEVKSQGVAVFLHVGGWTTDEWIVVAEDYESMRSCLVDADIRYLGKPHVFDMRQLKAYFHFVASRLQCDVIGCVSSVGQQEWCQSPDHTSHDASIELILHAAATARRQPPCTSFLAFEFSKIFDLKAINMVPRRTGGA